MKQPLQLHATALLALLSLVAPGVVIGQTSAERAATGVLYRIEGGLVGSAGGSIKLFSGGHEILLNFKGSAYRESLKDSGFTSPESVQIGAVWKVWYIERPTGDGGLELWLNRASFTHRFDQDVHAANQAVLGLFRSLDRRDYKGAMLFVTPSYQGTKAYLELKRSPVEIAMKPHLFNFCTYVFGKDTKSISIFADLGCFHSTAEAGSGIVFQVNRGQPERKVFRSWPLRDPELSR